MITEQGRVLELLLSGEFICQTKDEDAFRFLQSSANRLSIESQLQILNRNLSTAADGEVFFASYILLQENERKFLSSQFQEISSHLMPVVEWLLMVQEAMGTDRPLTQGTVIRLNELQSVVEDTPAYAEQLGKISRYALFGSKAAELDAQLKLIFKRLVEVGYLIRPNQDKQIYTATGKIDYLFDVLKFIDETENLSLSERAEDAISQTKLI
ncbi:hypothetical protein KO525_03085 [Psychrosphaera sp. B3R10]|uniref:hypothetical protein n=1 Tax=unclassified Psychrosphaera TaxID=2641570 RepID=UPI001C0A1E28|nr:MULTISPECIES: hypothetical protein [unclassified Psychrosphaera]MBU2881259.1 hypothetical protein [Psychrosphaera sp. I2R16]MBU2988358.1 hypothetical protein [Psychrosphaera sp. B3R10]MDO6720142.1 hypothetical protein [Psychrosphaera sp. 1_MG-2023]